MKIYEDEKKKITATKPASFTMRILRPLANLIAKYTSPSEINSVVKQFGFEKDVRTPDEACAALLQIFEILREEDNDKDIKKIIEALLTLYAHLIDERSHEKGLIGHVREILWRGHFNLGFHAVKKEYLVVPFSGIVHGIIMRADGTTENDFQDETKYKMRPPDSSNYYIVKFRDDFMYEGVLLKKVRKGTNYYNVFDAVYVLAPKGGSPTYAKISAEVKKRISGTLNFSDKKMAKFIQDNLNEHNGFLHHAKIKNTLAGGKDLIHIDRGVGVDFNNCRSS